MIQKQEQLAKEQYRFINYFISHFIIIQFVYGIINLVYNNFYAAMGDSVNIFVMLTIVILINKTKYNFEAFAKKAVSILVTVGNFNIFLTWGYTHSIFTYNIVMLLAITYIFSFKYAVYFAIAFVVIMILMIIGTHHYDISEMIKINTTKGYIDILNYSTIVLAISLSLVFIFSFKKMYKLKVQIELLEELEKEKNVEFFTRKTETVDVILPDKFDNLYNEIITYFESEKPWQDPDFNLNKLTTTLKSNVVNVSSTLNQKGKRNFTTMVNQYRIQQVKEAIKNGEHKRFTIKHLYTEAGFINQSTFNRIFRQMEGVSPQEYIEKQIN